MSVIARRIALALAALPLACRAAGGEAPGVFDELLANSRWVLGAAINSTPEYAGSNRRENKLAPIYAYQYGRLRFSAGGAGGLLNFGTDVVGPGAAAELKTSGKVRMGASLRIDGGRQSSDSVELAGLPDVRRTLRGRFYASTEFATRWTAVASLSQDLLGRGGGALLGVDVGYALATSPRTTWTAGGGIAFGDATYMRSYYGVSSAASTTSGLPAFDAGAGPRDVHIGVGWTSALTPRWIAFSSIGASTLLGGAANSPITRGRNSVSASVGIGYRCCTP